MSGLLSTMCARRADGAPGVLRRVAVVGEHADRGGLSRRLFRLRVDQLDQAVQLGELVLRQRLGRVEIQRARRRVLEDRVEDRPVEAQRLARGGRRDDDGAAPGQGVGHRLGLVGVELADAAGRQRADQPAIERLGHRRVHRGRRRQPPDGSDHDIARDGRMPVRQVRGPGRGHRHARPRRRRLEQRPGSACPGTKAAQGVQYRLLGVCRLGDREGRRRRWYQGPSRMSRHGAGRGRRRHSCGHTVAAAASAIKRRNQPTPGPFGRLLQASLQSC